MRAVRIARTGGPEVLEVAEDAPEPQAGPGQLVVRNRAIGVNFIDTYHRSGLYPVELPSGLGSEGAGVVESIGDGVSGFAPGDLVAYAGGPLGAYAELHAVPARRTVRLPEGLSTETAAAGLLKGMTAEMLLRRCYVVKAGQTILVHAAAGGVGQILVQWAKHLGAKIIATVGSREKAERVAALGADHVILYGEQDVAAEVRKITDGAGVPVAYDSVGAATFEGTLGSLARRGLFVSFGNASGPPPPVDALRLMRGGSLFFTRASVFDYTVTRPEVEESARALFEVLTSGAVKVEVGQTFPLAEAARAHESLQGRQTIGSSLLIP